MEKCKDLLHRLDLAIIRLRNRSDSDTVTGLERIYKIQTCAVLIKIIFSTGCRFIEAASLYIDKVSR